MSTHKHINKICCGIVSLCLVLTVLFMGGGAWGLQAASAAPGYEGRLFDTSRVHTIDIVMDDWDDFLDGCEDEEYAVCAVVVDGESRKNVGIRAKGNTSLTQVSQYGNDRYSFKVEFDHYDSTQNYYGLDKLSLNNLIQDNTCMKDYLVYQMMGAFGVPAPLCSYAYLTVNGEDWGLYLAVEGVEDAFLQRNFGKDYGELYKPDSMDMGGGRGNGGGFDMAGWQEQRGTQPETGEAAGQEGGNAPPFAGPGGFGMDSGQGPSAPQQGSGEEGSAGNAGHPWDGSAGGMPPDGFPGDMPGGGMGADDVSLLYSDDDPDSYPNIFDNAKTDITDADKARLIKALRQVNQTDGLDGALFTEEVMRYFVVHNFVCNFDSYTGAMIHNYYLYEEDGKLAMLPWDYNLAFGGFMGAQDAAALVNYPIDTPVSGGTVDSRPMLAWIFSDEAYTEQYHQLFSEFISQFFGSGACTEIIRSAQALIAPYVEKDPTKFCTYEEFQDGVEALAAFCDLRAESVSGQLSGAVPATQEGQSQQSGALVDAGSLDINDMGGMNQGGMGRGGFGGFAPNQAGSSEDGQDNAGNSENGMPAMPESGLPDGADIPDFGGRQEVKPENMDDRTPPGDAGQGASAKDWALVGASFAVLALGIGGAWIYRKKV